MISSFYRKVADRVAIVVVVANREQLTEFELPCLIVALNRVEVQARTGSASCCVATANGCVDHRGARL